jgi:hypothetical protein
MAKQKIAKSGHPREGGDNAGESGREGRDSITYIIL